MNNINGPLKVGIGGGIGTGKTSLTEALCRHLSKKVSMAVISNDIYTTEDAEYLMKAQVLPLERIKISELNKSNFSAYEGTRFSKMREECQKTVPGILDSEYLGSRFVLRVIKNNIATDERTLSVSRLDNRNIHIFSGKVVGAIKAAKEVAECLSQSS